MDKETALKVLRDTEHHVYIGWSDESDQPDTGGGSVVLDGTFTKQELLALLAFFD